MSYTKLLPRLIQRNFIALTLIEPLKPPYLRWYDKNAYCDYHFGAQGHSIENCKALKYRVQALIKGGYLDFLDEPDPNVIKNLFANHAEPKVNAITKKQSQKIKTNVEEVKAPIKVIYEVLVKVGFLELGKVEQEKKRNVRIFL